MDGKDCGDNHDDGNGNDANQDSELRAQDPRLTTQLDSSQASSSQFDSI